MKGLTIHKKEHEQYVFMTELYDMLELNPSNYTHFIKRTLLKNPFADQGKDYVEDHSLTKTSERGHFRQEYILHVDFAMKVCMVAKSNKAEKIRDYLVTLIKKRESKELLSIEEATLAHLLINYFKYVANQVEAEKDHKRHYIATRMPMTGYHKGMGHLAAQFHQYRNEMMNLEPEYIEQKLKEFCLENQRAYKKTKNKRDALAYCDRYELIKSAVFDVLMVNGTDPSKAVDFASAVKRMAENAATQLYRNNETDLFHTKQEDLKNPVPQIGNIKSLK